MRTCSHRAHVRPSLQARASCSTPKLAVGIATRLGCEEYAGVLSWRMLCVVLSAGRAEGHQRADALQHNKMTKILVNADFESHVEALMGPKSESHAARCPDMTLVQ